MIVKIYIKVRARDLLLVRPIYVKSTTTILLHVIVSVGIRLIPDVSRDFIFKLGDSKSLLFFAYLVDTRTTVILVKNNSN